MMSSTSVFIFLATLIAFAAVEETAAAEVSKKCKICCDEPFKNIGSCCEIPALIDPDVAKECGAGNEFAPLLKPVGSTKAKVSNTKQESSKTSSKKKKTKRAVSDRSVPGVWDCIFKKMNFLDEIEGEVEDDEVINAFGAALTAWTKEDVKEMVENCGDIVETQTNPKGQATDHKAFFFMNCLRRNLIITCPAAASIKKDPKTCPAKIKAVESCMTGEVMDPPKEPWEEYQISDEEMKKMVAQMEARREEKRKLKMAKGLKVAKTNSDNKKPADSKNAKTPNKSNAKTKSKSDKFASKANVNKQATRKPQGK